MAPRARECEELRGMTLFLLLLFYVSSSRKRRPDDVAHDVHTAGGRSYDPQPAPGVPRGHPSRRRRCRVRPPSPRIFEARGIQGAFDSLDIHRATATLTFASDETWRLLTRTKGTEMEATGTTRHVRATVLLQGRLTSGPNFGRGVTLSLVQRGNRLWGTTEAYFDDSWVLARIQLERVNTAGS